MSAILRIIEVVTAAGAAIYLLLNLVEIFRHARKRLNGKLPLTLILCLLPSISEADCSGSGVTWSCTAGTTLAQVSTALGSASDGATLTFADGSYTWSSGSTANFDMAKAATLKCADGATCTVAVGGNAALGMNGTCSGTSTKLYRISGFTFTGASSGNGNVWFNAFNAPPCTLTNIRIDHNAWSSVSGSDSRLIAFGDNSNNSFFYGVIDHNTITSTDNFVLAEFYGSNGDDAPTGARGSANNMFFEDNVLSVSSGSNPSAGCIDITGSAGIVWRFNTTTNCLLTSHGTTNYAGTFNYEVYGNLFTITSGMAGTDHDNCYRCFHHQGSGELIIFHNALTPVSGHDTNALEMAHYRSGLKSELYPSNPATQCDGTDAKDGNRTPLSTYRGYPCWQQPGRDPAGTLQPMYAWANYWTDDNTKVDLVLQQLGVSSPNYFTLHFVDQRDYYNAVSATAQTSSTSPFDGTTGVGHGIIARRPSACSVGQTDAGDSGDGGVGYASTDQGSWKTATPSQGVTGMPAYVFYRCGTTDTWSTHYTPYTYPHPLVSGSPGTGAGSIIVFIEWAGLVLSVAWHFRQVAAAGALTGLSLYMTGKRILSERSYQAATSVALKYLMTRRRP